MPARTVAYFVTPHGFGHAARSAAVMEALGARDSEIEFEIVTTVPEWFFAQSLTVRWRLRRCACDVGLVQTDPVQEDLPATVAALEEFWSRAPETTRALVAAWEASPPELVVSDISPLGLEVARRLGVPSVLVENFTWEWIYSAYFEAAPELRPFAERTGELTRQATLHVQCEPMCEPNAAATRVGVVSRIPRAGKAATRRALGLEANDSRPLVLLTMGGMGWGSRAPDLGSAVVAVSLGGVDAVSRESSIVRLPDRSPVFPPDLVAAADVVVAKLGYSTVAESLATGARLAYIGRERFAESPVLEAFVRRTMAAVELRAGGQESGEWASVVTRLLSAPPTVARPATGAVEIAELLLAMLA